MPAAWSKKDERMYEAIKESCLDRGDRSAKVCKRIAAATVNKRRQEEGRTLSEFNEFSFLTGNTLIDALSIGGLIVVGVYIFTSYSNSKFYTEKAERLQKEAEIIEAAAKAKL